MYYIGVDLGGTNIAVGIVDENNAIVKKASTPTKPERGADAIVADMAAVAKSLMADLGITAADIGWAGVASPGTVDHERGVVVYANNIPFLDYPLADNLSALLGGIPVHAENDANAAAKAEAIAGAARGARYSVMITLGTGLGGGIVIDGKIYSGSNFAGAELGHMVIVKDCRECGCGRKGCWEAYASATALINMTKEAIRNEKAEYSYMLHLADDDIDNVNGKTAFDAQQAGDNTGAEVVEKYIGYLATGLINIINIFQPDVLCIGGGIAGQGENLLGPLHTIIEQERFTKYNDKQTKVCIATLGNDAGIIGAACL
jgi:glucokinase